MNDEQIAHVYTAAGAGLDGLRAVASAAWNEGFYCASDGEFMPGEDDDTTDPYTLGLYAPIPVLGLEGE